YFGRGYGTKHHFGWLKQTIAHNTLLIDGEGQVPDALLDHAKILSVTDDGTTKKALLDLTSAYPQTKKCLRTLTLSGKVLTVTDEVEADHAVALTLPLHTLSAPFAADGKVCVEHRGAHLTITPDAKAALREISDKFGVDLNEGVPEAFHAVMPPQWHVYFDVPAAERHVVTMTYTVE
ncbi:MAG: heparinase II/III family protein, partial [Clostridia bacterium]|nr:heparinase II/III family protein [Clostridia bacterium]